MRYGQREGCTLAEQEWVRLLADEWFEGRGTDQDGRAVTGARAVPEVGYQLLWQKLTCR
ncbi:hypothetical protein [Nonomuraea sp. NPDC049784]|uniref:hypothetical protein n=1 Tax=Nonomuraea sp. NPDC049784 TaxID=3154361 RepID=UPI0033DB00F0